MDLKLDIHLPKIYISSLNIQAIKIVIDFSGHKIGVPSFDIYAVKIDELLDIHEPKISIPSLYNYRPNLTKIFQNTNINILNNLFLLLCIIMYFFLFYISYLLFYLQKI